MFRPALLLMAGRTAGLVVTALMPLVFVRSFSQAEFGAYKQLFLLYATLYALAQCGMAESLFYFLPRARARLGSYIVNAMLILAAAGVGCAALLHLGGARISAWLSNPALVQYLPLMGAYLFLSLASATLEIVMISDKRYGWAAFSYVASDLGRAAFSIIPVLMAPKLHWLLAGATAFAAIRLVATWVYLKVEFAGELRPDAALLRDQFAYAIPFELAVVVDTFQSNFHQYAVSHYFDAVTFAVYSVGCLQIPFVGLVASSVGNVLMVGMSEELREGSVASVVPMWHDTVRKLSLMFFPLVALLLVVAHELIVFLFTDQYLASVPIFMLWTLATLFAVFQTDSVLRVFAETRFLFWLNTARLATVLLLMPLCLSSGSLLGPVVVTLIATALTKGLAVVRIRKLMQVTVAEMLPWGSLFSVLAASAAAALPAELVRQRLHGSPLVILVLTTMMFAVAYLVLLFTFQLLTAAERHEFRALLHRSKIWLLGPSPAAVPTESSKH